MKLTFGMLTLALAGIVLVETGLVDATAGTGSLSKEQMATIYGGGPGPGGPLAVTLDAKCAASSLCNGIQTACGQKADQSSCLSWSQRTLYSGNRDYCGPLAPEDAVQDCQQGSTYTCLIDQQCTWQNGACVVLTGGAAGTQTLPSSCTDIPRP